MKIVILHQFDKIFGVGAIVILDRKFSGWDKVVFPARKMKDAAEEVMPGRLSDQQLFL